MTAAVTPPLSGVGYHIIRLLERLDRCAPPEFQFRLFYASVNRAASDAARRLLPTSSRMRFVAVPFVTTSLAALHRAYWGLLLPSVIRHHRCALFHGPAHILPRMTGTPTVVTIHDLGFFDHELYDPSFTLALRQAVRDSLSRATAVIALSEHTRRHIQRITERTDAVHVIYGAGNYADASAISPQESDPAALQAAGVSGRYVLYVGDFNPRKNLGYLIESFALLTKSPACADVQLVLAGNSQSARARLEEQGREAGLQPGDVVMTGRVSDELLCILYRNASAFALCSLMEGFTLVTLEAMSYGVPVVATDTSSIAEGTGQAAELVPLGDPASVARALEVAITPGPRRDEMRRLGFDRIQRFTWEAAAGSTLALYEATARRVA